MSELGLQNIHSSFFNVKIHLWLTSDICYSLCCIPSDTSWDITPISNKCKHVTVSLGFPFYYLQIDSNGSWTSTVQIGCLSTFNIGKLFLQSINYYNSDLLWKLNGQFIMAPFSNECKTMFLTQSDVKRIELALDIIKVVQWGWNSSSRPLWLAINPNLGKNYKCCTVN